MKLVGVTKCPAGFAHTYIAAEMLEQASENLKFDIKVETQGAMGIENALTSQDIAEADFVILAIDAEIEGHDRFDGKRVLEKEIKDIISGAEEVLRTIDQTASLQGEATEEMSNQAEERQDFFKHFFAGLSYLYPLLVVQGVLAVVINYLNLQQDMTVYVELLLQLEKIILPLFAAFLAQSVAGRNAFAPALIATLFATFYPGLNQPSSQNIILAIINGVFSGYIVKALKKIPINKDFLAVLPSYIFPLVTTTILILFASIGGAYVTNLMMDQLINILEYILSTPYLCILFAGCLGYLVSYDFGGRLNKTAYALGVLSLITGQFQVMGIIAVAICTPPLSYAIYQLLHHPTFDKSLFTKTLGFGINGLTEGAKPFVNAQTKVGIVCGTIAASIGAAIFHVEIVIPNGGLLAGIIGSFSNAGTYFASIGIGIVITVLITSMTQKGEEKND